MTYLALLVALMVGGVVIWQQYPLLLSNQVDNGSVYQDGISSALDVAGNLSDLGINTNNEMITENISQNSSNVESEEAPVILPEDRHTMLVAGGCFWCVEADLEKLPGVISVVSGYAGGTTNNPTYSTYISGGHREVVEVTYDANIVTFEAILIYAMKHMDPTDGDGSFNDRGDYYSPAFYYTTQAEKTLIANLIAEVDANGPYQLPLAIDIETVSTFWPAEDYHQDYYKGALSKLKYQYYRRASGRDEFINNTWGSDTGPTLPWREQATSASSVNNSNTTNTMTWTNYIKPDKATLKGTLSTIEFSVTQEEGTERSGSSPLDKEYGAGIYVDILSGEPLFSSRDKFDSGTGWPSFVKPITAGAVTEHIDKRLFTSRTEIRSAIADNHLGHVFTDGPANLGGLRYCMNGVALRFVPQAQMGVAGYGDYLQYI